MSDFYTEQLVKQKTPVIYTVIKMVLCVITALAAVAAVLMPFLVLPVVILGLIDYLLFPRWNVEFEYILVNTDLDVDKIMSQNKRKRFKSFDLKKMEIMAPVNSHALDSYNQKNYKTIDISSRTGSPDTYAMFIMDGQEMVKVIIEPDKDILSGIKLIASRKVVA